MPTFWCTPDAVGVLAEAAARAPGTGWNWRQLGAAQVMARRLDDAALSLGRAVTLLPTDFWPRKHLSEMHEHAGRPDRAVAEARIALELRRGQMPELLGELVARLERAR